MKQQIFFRLNSPLLHDIAQSVCAMTMGDVKAMATVEQWPMNVHWEVSRMHGTAPNQIDMSMPDIYDLPVIQIMTSL